MSDTEKSGGAARGPPEQIPHTHFQCDLCLGVFEKGWSEAESLSEKQALWGDGPIPGGEAVVCDDCFRELMGETPAERDKTAGAVRTMLSDIATEVHVARPFADPQDEMASKASDPEGVPQSPSEK